jgi:hypothetical protein
MNVLVILNSNAGSVFSSDPETKTNEIKEAFQKIRVNTEIQCVGGQQLTVLATQMARSR